MNIDDIHDEWAKDCVIDKTNIGYSAANTPSLHAKYQRWYSDERLRLKKLEADYTILKKDKIEFYIDGPNEETQAKGWKLPPKGRIPRVDVALYTEADPDIINLSLRIGLQREIVDSLESILKSIGQRTFLFNAINEFNKFMAGG